MTALVKKQGFKVIVDTREKEPLIFRESKNIIGTIYNRGKKMEQEIKKITKNILGKLEDRQYSKKEVIEIVEQISVGLSKELMEIDITYKT